MKIPDFKNLKKLFTKKNFAHHKSSLNMHPAHDWKIVVRISLLIGVLLILFSLYLSYSITHDQIFQATSATSNNLASIKENLLQSTLNSFANKATKEQALLQTAPVVTDPSR